MKLYSQDDSPFCTPVRAAIYAKGLDIAIEPPPGGLKSEAYRAVSLTGTIPCLILDDGTPLPESMVILEYLEDRFPETPLKPASPEERAHEALIRRISESDLSLPAVQLFHDLRGPDPEAGKATALARFERGLGLVEQLAAGDGYICGDQFTLADCVLAPALLGLTFFGPLVGRPSLMADHPKVAAYFGRASRHPAVARVFDELRAALAASGVSLG